MGTYTDNYNLFMPSIGEQGWGELVNGNFATIDITMKSINNNIVTLETEMDALAVDIAALEGVSNGGAIKSKSITNNGTITSTGLITGNGGFKGNLTGNVTGSATSLNKTITIGISSTQFTKLIANSPYTICPLVPGVVYGGTVKGKSSWGGINVHIYKNGAWSSAGRIGNTGTSSSAEGSVSFSGASIVMLTSNDTNAMKHDYIYLPTYSY